MITENGVQHSPLDYVVNNKNQDGFNAHTQNNSGVELLSPQGTIPSIQGSTNQPHLNIATNNMMIYNVHQAENLYPTSSPQDSKIDMEGVDGRSSWDNQQSRNNGLFNNFIAPMHSFLSGYQYPQCNYSIEANVSHPQFSRPMSPGPSASRPTQSNNRLQLPNPVLGMPNFHNVHVPHDYHMTFVPSMHPRPQNFSHELNLGPMESNIYDLPNYNSMVPDDSFLSLRTSKTPNHQVQSMTDLLISQYCNPILHSPVPSRLQQSNSGHLNSRMLDEHLNSRMLDESNTNSTTSELYWVPRYIILIYPS
ncbi:hypothetical protein Tsubulata_008572 [Turnera subulata]|uniref:Uncharacterized protein n=1 Tax=Turnera subulata TaxID=218843 RepID=A0A9Q0G068_9ROSI|nr:hypothetical protein Tsubulata_008572 [Turnera subulata]